MRQPSPHITLSAGRLSVIHLSGDWTTRSLLELDDEILQSAWPESETITLDASEVGPLDTSGAWMLNRLVTSLQDMGKEVHLQGLDPKFEALLELVRDRLRRLGEFTPPRPQGSFEKLGRLVYGGLQQATDLLAFTGEVALAFLRSLRDPTRIRFRLTVGVIQAAGLLALPIVGLLTFLLGIVIAYQGGLTLEQYGANIFIVELVTITMFREMGPLIAAIIVAGRTGSAFTAEIGTMKVTEEIDALTTLGMSPTDVLVLPKVIGLMVALPLLTLFADAMGVLGGMVAASSMLGVSFEDFFNRIPDAIKVSTFVVGVGKAPAFAAIIAMVGCFQGFQVEGGAESVGQQTTRSVVRSIFLVIVADAAFSILFSWLGI
jgi:phospholipid/cholesterol/gamma-HCH transport system permease protein